MSPCSAMVMFPSGTRNTESLLPLFTNDFSWTAVYVGLLRIQVPPNQGLSPAEMYYSWISKSPPEIFVVVFRAQTSALGAYR